MIIICNNLAKIAIKNGKKGFYLTFLVSIFVFAMNDLRKDLFEGLNTPQKEAVMCTEGPSLIIAGAGSGKTRVLTCRVAHILEHCECRPSEVLALTFTKKAAGEMKERIGLLVGEQKARWIYMGTFHSIFIRFLREYADRLGYPQQFTIYDKTDSQSIIKQCIKELNLDDKSYKPSYVMSVISLAKNSLITVKGYRADAERLEADKASRRPRLVDIYELYQRKCREAGSMDFDDILLNMNILFRDHPDTLESIGRRFKYIMVDEYQDTNFSQYLILKKLAAIHGNICVVGDDSQSIYGFRGARIENILRFRKDYPGAKEFKLEQNYRSTKNIVSAANSLISHNERRLKKDCFSNAGDGEKIKLIKAFTDSEEGYLVASAIVDRIHSDKAAYSDFALLYRTNAQSRALEEALRKKNIPFRIYGGHSFYERAEIKDMLAYFKLVVNQKDNEAFSRVVNAPARGIGATSLERLGTVAKSEGCSLFDAALLPFDKLAVQGIREASARKFRDFANLILSFAEKASTQECYSLALEIGDRSGYLASLRNDTSPEGVARFENVEELFSSIKEFSEEESEMREVLAGDNKDATTQTVTIGDYIENIYLMSEVEKDDTQDSDIENSNKVTLMTIHSSKGLEFPYVFITGMEENLFPSESMNDTPDKIEEERRLFYVAITRAEKSVTLSFAQTRRKWGSEESNRPSRFLREIDDTYLERPLSIEDRKPDTSINHPDRYARITPPVQRSTSPNYTPRTDFSPSPVNELQLGQKVEHDRFGFGTIISFDGEGINHKAVVTFENGGEKTLLLKFAKLRIVK